MPGSISQVIYTVPIEDVSLVRLYISAAKFPVGETMPREDFTLTVILASRTEEANTSNNSLSVNVSVDQ